MKSKVKYIYDSKDSRLRKEVCEEISNNIKEYDVDKKNHYSSGAYYDLLVNAKYIIERNNLNFSNILEGDTLELEVLLRNNYKEMQYIQGILLIAGFKKYKLYEVLRKMIYDDYEIDTYYDRVLDSYIEDNKKYLIISDKPIDFINHSNVDIYYEKLSSSTIFNSQMKDLISGFNRKYYTSLDEIKFKEYDLIIYISSSKEYVDINKVIGKRIFPMEKLLMICNYSAISKYNKRLEYIKNILIDKDKAYIEYWKENLYKAFTNKDEITIGIKELSNVKDEDLKEIINSDKEIENISIHTTLKDIKNNGYRIGFNAYNKELNKDKSKIIRLIDYNDYLTSKINDLNKEISDKINNMIVR